LDRYQLGKIVQWAGTLRSRKRLQKVSHLLQAGGCPFAADFFLHHYGPYSREVAGLCDEMVAARLLDETETSKEFGREYAYKLTVEAEKLFAATESDSRFAERASQMKRFEDLARELLGTDLFELEVASTIAYFQQRQKNWEQAVTKACEFKRLNRTIESAGRAEALARKVLGKSE
jgi:uncharacterized protein YwgA